MNHLFQLFVMVSANYLLYCDT